MTTSKNRVFPQSYNRTIVPLKKHCAFDNLKQPKMDIARANRRIFFYFYWQDIKVRMWLTST